MRSSALQGNPTVEARPEQDQAEHQESLRVYRAAAPAHNSLQWSLFNATASFLGLPGVVSPVDGLRDEGAGFHADGTTRRMGEGDGSAGAFTGQRAASYMRSGLMVQQPWLYDDLMGGTRDADGRFWGMGSEYSGVRRNGYGYGRQLMGGDNMLDSALRKGLSAGMGFANSAVESSILGLMGKDSPYGSGKARLNFYLDLDQKGTARLQGEGDVLWPLYDNPWTTVYTQFGARSMYGGGEQYGPDRWIGNVGLGQRWFPAATVSEDGALDSGNWMVGYNAFFDYDITRGHQRGGVGLEAQYDWLKIATNWYAPLSGWKDSKDFDGSFVEERAAQGWDARIKGYLPFYREVALTGAYTQWYGDHVGMFGPSKLEKDPKIWSYGVEYTPVPAMTAFVNQRQTERGRADTEFGLRFTYNFGMDAESQFKPSRVAEMRTVHGARHDFVDRENKIILEYRTKNRFRIDFVGFDGRNTFSFRLRGGFDKAAAGQVVRVVAGGPVTVAEAPVREQSLFAQVLNVLGGLVSVRSAHADSGMSYTTDGEGTIRVRVDNPGKLDSLSLSAGETTTGFTRDSMGLGPKVVADIQSEKLEVDANGNTLIHIKGAAYNADVQWKVESIAPSTGSGSISGGDKTNDKGEATATFAAVASGAVNVIATVGGERIACQVTVKDNPYTITVSPSTLPQLTSQEVTFTVKKNGSAVDGGISASVAANPALGVTASTPSTDGSGQFKLTLTPTGAASSPQQLVFTIDSKPITVDFTVNALNLSLTPTPTEIYAGGVTTVTLTNAPVGVQVEWSVTSNGELSGQQNTVQNGGKATATLKAKNDATGTITVTAKIGGASGLSKTCAVTVKENAYEITASPTALTQLTSQEVTFAVKKNGSTVGGGISVSATANTALGVTASSPTTDGSGQFKLTLTPTGTASSSQQLMFTIDSKPITVDFTVNTLNLTLTPSAEIFAGASTTVTLAGAPVGVQVEWSVTANGELSNQQNTVQSGGTATATLKAKNDATGTITVTAKVGGASGISKTCAVPVKETVYEITASPTTLTQLASQEVTFTVKKNGTATDDIAVSIAANTNLSITSTQSKTTAGGGQFKLTLTPTGSAGATEKLTLTIDGAGHDIDFMVNTHSLQLAAIPTSIFVSGTSTLTLSNAPVGATVAWAIESGSGSLSEEQTTVQAGGTATAKLTGTAAGSVVAKATVNGATQTATVTVKENVYEITASPTTLTQLVSQEVTFTVKKNGTATDGISVSIAANSNLGVASTQSKTTAGGGQFKLTLTPTGSAAVTEKLTLTLEGAGHDIGFSVNPHSLQLAAAPTSIFARDASTLTLSSAPVGETVAWAHRVRFRQPFRAANYCAS